MKKSITLAAIAALRGRGPGLRRHPAPGSRAKHTSAPASTTVWRTANSRVPKPAVWRPARCTCVAPRRAPSPTASLPGRERAHLQHEANQQSRRIYRQKHDAQDRN